MENSQQQFDEGRLDEILAEYLQALESGHAPDRQALLDSHPQYAAELREFFVDRDQFQRAVRPLVAANSSGGEGSAAATRGGEFTQPSALGLVRYFGDYELISELGRGGMGVVYRARQITLNRQVALKMVLAGKFAGPNEVKRFQVEAENAACLDHPHIVPIYEVGRHQGQHYYSMKLIEGGNLATQIPRFVADPRAAATLIAKTALALHYAHEHGILHRDLKPSNILVDSHGDPQITDFGLARRMEQESDLTISGAVLGSPRYMAPEQARGEKALTISADVYSLGAILYELLTGHPPFVAATALETLRMVREQEPQRPSAHLPKVDRDLETVCLKCLEKLPANRYETAQALAQDLQRWLAGELIKARPTTLLQRATKWARRRPAIAALAALTVITVFLLVGVSIALPYGIRLGHALNEARLARKETDRARHAEAIQAKLTEGYFYLSNITLAERDITAGNVKEAEELLDACPEKSRGWEWYHLTELCHLELSSLPIDKRGIIALSISPTQRQLAVVCASGLLQVLDADTLKLVFQIRGRGITCAAFSPDGLLLAIAQKDAQIKFLDTISGNELRGRELLANPNGLYGSELKPIRVTRVTALAFSPDATTLALGAQLSNQRGSLLLLDVNGPGSPIQIGEGPDWQFGCLAFSHNGSWLLSGAHTPTISNSSEMNPRKYTSAVQLWPIARINGAASATRDPTREVIQTFKDGDSAIQTVAISPDDTRVAAGTADRNILVWTIDGGPPIATFSGHTDAITAVVFDPRDRLYSAGDNSVHGWYLSTRREIFVHHGHAPVSALAYDPVTRHLFSADAEGRLNLWDSEPQFSKNDTFSSRIASDVAFSRDGGQLAIAEPTKLAVWRLADNTRLFEWNTLPGNNGHRVAFNADGKRLAISEANSVALYAANTDAIPDRVNFPHAYGVAFSPDGRRIAASSGDGTAGEWAIWDVASMQALMRVRIKNAAFDIAFSPDGQFVVIGGGHFGVGRVGATGGLGGIPGQVVLFNSLTGEPVRNFSGIRYCVWGVAISPDGTRIACAAGMYANERGEVKVWDTATGEELLTLPCPHCPFRVAFSNDSSRLAATGGRSGGRTASTVMLWDLRTGRETFRFPISATAYGLAFNPSGPHLAAATLDGVRLWGPGKRPTPATQPSVPTSQRTQ